MGRHTKRLTEIQLDHLRTSWEASGGVISQVADEMGVSWQTARRWLIQAGYVKASQRLDRPGLVWPRFLVGLGQRWGIIVEAPNWAVACEAIKIKSGMSPVKVERTKFEADEGLDRESVKALCPGYMDHSLTVADLMRHYFDLGVIIK